MREYLDPFVKADQCAQKVDDKFAATNPTDCTRNIRAVFDCISEAGLKLTVEKCHFRVRQLEYLSRAVLLEKVSPQNHKIQNSLNKSRFSPKSENALQCYLGSVNYYETYIPWMAEKVNRINKLLKAETPVTITSELKKACDSINKELNDACEHALKHLLPGKQLVLMTNASLRGAGLASY